MSLGMRVRLPPSPAAPPLAPADELRVARLRPDTRRRRRNARVRLRRAQRDRWRHVVRLIHEYAERRAGKGA